MENTTENIMSSWMSQQLHVQCTRVWNAAGLINMHYIWYTALRDHYSRLCYIQWVSESHSSGGKLAESWS